MNRPRFAFFRFLLVVASLLVLRGAAAEEVGMLHLTPLHLELPATWSFDGSKQPIEGTGPSGEKVLISIMRRRHDSATDELPSPEAVAQSSHGRMTELATKGGKSVVRPLQKIAVPDGKAGYSIASEATSLLRRKSYFAQYLLAARGVVIYITLEGKGEAKPVLERFDAVLQTQTWDE